ncbi:transposase, partial [Limosilactobacillus reuteri]
MYQNKTLGQTEFVIKYKNELNKKHVVRIIWNYVDLLQ